MCIRDRFYNLIPTLTVRQNILMPLLLDKKKPNQEYFDQLVNSLGISGKLAALPDQLSGGQQQRTAIARSLIYRPALLLSPIHISGRQRQPKHT